MMLKHSDDYVVRQIFTIVSAAAKEFQYAVTDQMALF